MKFETSRNLLGSRKKLEKGFQNMEEDWDEI